MPLVPPGLKSGSAKVHVAVSLIQVYWDRLSLPHQMQIWETPIFTWLWPGLWFTENCKF